MSVIHFSRLHPRFLLAVNFFNTLSSSTLLVVDYLLVVHYCFIMSDDHER